MPPVIFRDAKDPYPSVLLSSIGLWWGSTFKTAVRHLLSVLMLPESTAAGWAPVSSLPAMAINWLLYTQGAKLTRNPAEPMFQITLVPVVPIWWPTVE